MSRMSCPFLTEINPELALEEDLRIRVEVDRTRNRPTRKNFCQKKHQSGFDLIKTVYIFFYLSTVYTYRNPRKGYFTSFYFIFFLYNVIFNYISQYKLKSVEKFMERILSCAYYRNELMKFDHR